MFENIEMGYQKKIRLEEESRREVGYGYDLTHIIRENLMWACNLPYTVAQKVAEHISEQAYFANWITIALPDGKWNTFKKGGK